MLRKVFVVSICISLLSSASVSAPFVVQAQKVPDNTHIDSTLVDLGEFSVESQESGQDIFLEEFSPASEAAGPFTDSEDAVGIAADLPEFSADSQNDENVVWAYAADQTTVPELSEKLFVPLFQTYGAHVNNDDTPTVEAASASTASVSGFGRSGDFNGDGVDDLVIPAPGEDIGSLVNAGAVHIIYGNAEEGLKSANNQIWHQDSPGVLGVAEAGDRFGDAIAVGNFNGDDYDDLAIGARYEDIGSLQDAGAVNVLYGSSRGLTASGDQVWHQNTGISGTAEKGDHFGGSLASGDLNNDGYDDLIVGSPLEDIGTAFKNAGLVQVILGSPSKLSTAGNKAWHEGTIGDVQLGAHLGESLVVGDFNNDNFDDFAAGVPLRDEDGIADAGRVRIFLGNGTNFEYWTWWIQREIAGQTTDPKDRFAAALASGDFDGDGFDDLAISAPLEDLGTDTNAGIVHILFSNGTTPSPFSALAPQSWDLNSYFFAREPDDRYGKALAVGDFDGDFTDDLAIGIGYKDVDVFTGVGTITRQNVGAVNIIYGRFGVGLDPFYSDTDNHTASQLWNQGSPGIIGALEDNDYFGLTLFAGNFDGAFGDDLAIGAPFEDLGGISNAGSVNVLYGHYSETGLMAIGDQIWHQDSPGIAGAAEGGDTFSYQPSP